MTVVPDPEETSPSRQEAVVPPDAAGQRLDEAVATLADTSRAAAVRWVTAGAVLVDGRTRPKSFRVTGGERLSWERPEPLPDPSDPQPEAIPLDIRHEDEYLLVVAKPPGLVVHPAPGHATGTLVNALLHHVGPLSTAGGAGRPGIVHRLDKDTSGLLLVAKNDAVHRALSEDLAARRIRRHYLALVQGHPQPEAAIVDAPIGRHPRDRLRMAVVPGGRSSQTSWQVRERLRATTLLELRLATGRTHQIRVHLAHRRHPVVGDLLYRADPNLAASLGATRPFLHAWRLGFRHPVTDDQVELTEPLPADLQTVLDRLHAGV